MTSRRSMTRDIHESIRLLLGKNTKVLLKVPVKLELKGDKTENRILVFTPHRLFIVTAKVPSRIDHHFHYIDIRRVESKRLNHIAFTFANVEKPLSFRPNYEQLDQTNSASTIDNVIETLTSAVRRVFPGVPLEHIIGKLDVTPADRIKHIVEWKPPDPKEIGPCGGFSAQYFCMCDYYSLPFREEVAWDVDTIYFSHDTHELCLQDFEHLDHRDLMCIISALEHNTWFTKLRASGNSSKLNTDLCDRILGVVAKSVSLSELHLSTIGARWDFAVKLSQAMASNRLCNLQVMDLSCNFLEDKGIMQMAASMAKMPKGMRHLNLSHASLTSKGISTLCQALITNRLNASSLTYLNLCGNNLRDDTQMLCSFLAQPNVVSILDLSNTETPLELLFPALVRGCTTSLTHLNLSRNPFSLSKKSKEIPPTFKQFFATSLSMQYLNISFCKLPPEALKHLLLGLACNEATANVELNLSNNNLGANGAVVLENCIGTVKCLARLDLSENALEAEMSGVLQGMAKNKSLMSLNLSKNMTGVKPKHLAAVMESLVQMIQEEDVVLQKLNLSDCKLKSEIHTVINALGSNQCLQTLDISGNAMGDVGARLLAKAIQINTRLKTIYLDRNGITLQGFTDLTYALQSNYAMRHIPLPTFDLQPMIKTHPERVDSIMHRMQELLQRNANPHRFKNTAQAFRLTQGFLLGSTQQLLDRVSASTQDSIDAWKKINPEAVHEPEVIKAKDLITEAENSKHLLSSLHEVTHRGDEVDAKLKHVSCELSSFMASHVQQNLELMLNTAKSQCASVLSSHNEARLRESLGTKVIVPPEFINSLVNDHIGLEVHNKINELNLIMANHISDRLIDEVIESLTATSKVLSHEVGHSKKKRSLTPDVLKNRSVSVSESLEQETLSISHVSASSDVGSQKSENSPLSTPQTSKRKSIQGRKLRPKSAADDRHEDSPTTSTPDLLNAMTSTPNASLNLNGSELDTVPELPAASSTTSGSGLQHLGKARPKRPKKHAPTRGTTVTRSTTADDSFDEGMDKFYNNSTNNASLNISGAAVAVAFTPGSSPPSNSTGSPMIDSKDGTPNSTLEKSSHKSKGFSCLASSTTDEDGVGAIVKTPEKKAAAASPSVQSISDIFAKTASSKVGNKSKQDDSGIGRALSPGLAAMGGVSPFTGRKASLETAKQQPPLAEEERTASPDPGQDGKKTPEELIRRHGVGHGNNPDLMAQIKEKRASMAHKANTPSSEDAAETTTSSGGGDSKSGGLFSSVKLRSTGLAGNLTSPTNEFMPASVKDKERKSSGDSLDNKKEAGETKPVGGGSIVGLRSSKFAAGLSNSPEAKPRTTTGMSTSSTTASSESGDHVSTTTTPALAPKPKPLPKPRPWSIVGVDRKSGEMTSVSDSNNTKESSDANVSSGSSGVRKGGVRDLINNMNKNESSSSSGESKKKGGSLPRGVQPPTSVGDHGQADNKSPAVPRKTDSTSDDPRIMKLDDDFGYEGVMDV